MIDSLNFVFLNNNMDISNGEGVYSRRGPFLHYIEANNISRTFDSKLKEGYRNVLLIEIDSGGYSVKDIPRGLIQFINENDIKLIIAGLPDPTAKETYQFSLTTLNSKNLDFNKLIYIDTNLQLSQIKTPFPHKVFTFNFFIEEALWSKQSLYDHTNELEYVSEPILPEELNTFRNKKFLCFNRSLDKAHRFMLLEEYLKGTFNDSYFSFIRPIDYATENRLFYEQYYGVELVDNLVDDYNKHIPIELDTHKTENKYSFRVSNTLKKELFLDSCINLVTETTFTKNELFLSEKILKPILSYQPFIVFGPQGYLKELRKYGFKTFSDFWDESYDDIENSVDRMKALLSLVKALNNKSIEELNDIYKSTIDICVHNRNLFYSLEIDTLKVILEEIKNEW